MLFFIGGAQNVSNTSDGFYDYSGDGGQVVIKPGLAILISSLSLVQSSI